MKHEISCCLQEEVDKMLRFLLFFDCGQMLCIVAWKVALSNVTEQPHFLARNPSQDFHPLFRQQPKVELLGGWQLAAGGSHFSLQP